MCRLLTVDRSHIPSNVVAPAHGLNPVYRAWVDPYQVSWPLDEPVHRDVSAVQVIQNRPPWSCQVVDSMPERKIHKLLNKVFILTKIRVRIKHCLLLVLFDSVFVNSFLLFTEITDGLPVVVMNSKPLTVSRPNIDVYGTEVIVLLVSWWYKHLTSIKKTTCQSRLSIFDFYNSQIKKAISDCVKPGVRQPGTFM